MADEFLIPVVLGSGREGRRSERMAHDLHEQILAADFDAPFVDVRDERETI